MTSYTTTDVVVPNAPDIPGLRFRLLRDDADYEPLAALIADTHLADGVEWIPDAGSLRVDYENMAEFDPRRQVILAEVDGRLVAFGRFHRELRDDTAVYMTQGNVHPDYRRRGLGRAILRYNVDRLVELASSRADTRQREFGAWATQGEVGGRALLESEGYRAIRYGFAMRRPTLDDLPAAPLPHGVELRPVSEADHRAIFDADNEAFRDHWGHRESTDEDFRALFGQPDLNTDLWRVAWDGSDVAGSVLTFVFGSENATLGVKRGWLERISVRRPWRRRGLAKALIVSALAGLRDAGMTEAMLGVDSENPTGALQLYESLGFVERDRGYSYRKAW
jgi:mycothiol synthase